jgi:hypothetical protein
MFDISASLEIKSFGFLAVELKMQSESGNGKF